MNKPTGHKVQPRSADSIRELANGIRQIFKIADDVYRVNLVSVLEHILPLHGIVYAVVDKQDLVNGSPMADREGLCIPDEGTIIIRSDVYDNLCTDQCRARFTLAHELGHLVMHRDIALPRSRTHIHRFYEDSEWQANTFAAEFMAPLRLVQKIGTSPRKISEVFGISFESATIRAREVEKLKY